jgi:hypothetical protein
MGCIACEVDFGVEFFPPFKTMAGSKGHAEFPAAHQSSMLVGHCMPVFMPDNIPECSVRIAQKGRKSAQ